MCAWVLQDDSIHKLCLSIMEDTNRPRFILVVYRKIWGVKPKLFIFLILKHNRCLLIYHCSFNSIESRYPSSKKYLKPLHHHR